MAIPLLPGATLLVAGQAIGAQALAPPVPPDTQFVTCEAKNPKPQATTISFDTKGVEFGPWIRRFASGAIGLVPAEASSFHGCAILSVRIRKNGTVVDVVTVNPSEVPAFTEAHGHSATFTLAGTGTSDPIDLLRWFATGKAGATGLWLVEHQHSDAPGSAYCRGSLALAGDHLVFRSENLSEGFIATADQVTTVNRRPGSQSFTVSFR